MEGFSGSIKNSSASKKSQSYLDDLRRTRTEGSVQLRKIKRIDRANLQRMKAYGTVIDGEGERGCVEIDSQVNAERKGVALSNQSIIEHGHMLYSDNSEVFMVGLVGCRALLARIKNPPIEAFVETGFVPRIIQMLLFDDFPTCQYEVAWIMTNIACAPVKYARFLHEAIPNLIKVWSTSKHDKVRYQVLWALSNLSADVDETGELLMQGGLLDPILHAMGMVCQGSRSTVAASPSLYTLGHIATIVVNLTRCKTFEQNRELYSVLIVILAELLQSPDIDCVTKICSGLRHIADAPQTVDLMLENGIAGRLRELVEGTSSRDASLRVLAVMLQSPQRLHIKLLLASQFGNLLPLVVTELGVAACTIQPDAKDASKIDAMCVDLLKAVQNVILADTKYSRHLLAGGIAESLCACVRRGHNEIMKYAVLVMACIVLGSPPEAAIGFAAQTAAVLVPALPLLQELDATVYALLALQHLLEGLLDCPRETAAAISCLLPVLHNLVNSDNMRVAEVAEKVEELLEKAVQRELVR